jgi:hypothetical protein
MSPESTELLTVVAASPLLSAALERLDGCEVPDWFLGAGAVAQTVWNALFGFPDGHGIRDLDIVYFDPDLPADAEHEVRREVCARLAGLGVDVDVKNQARVHLWYPESFGSRIRPYASMQDAMSTWPTTATAIGIRADAGAVSGLAVFGWSDVLEGVVRANRIQVPRSVFEEKSARWAGLWPGLDVRPWDEGVGAVGERLLSDADHAGAVS